MSDTADVATRLVAALTQRGLTLALAESTTGGLIGSLVTDVPGVLRDVADPSSRIPRLTREEGKKAIADGIITKGMIPKIDESFAAIVDGVRAVYVVGKLGPGDLARAIREPGSVGTVLEP